MNSFSTECESKPLVLDLGGWRASVAWSDSSCDALSRIIDHSFLAESGELVDASLHVTVFPGGEYLEQPDAPGRPPPILEHTPARMEYYSQEGGVLKLLYYNHVILFRPNTRQMRVLTFDRPDPARNARGMLAFLLQCVLALEGGVLVHGSGCVLGGLAAIITGVSGAGKSTATRLIRPDILLSDDATAVTNLRGTPYAHSTPVGGPSDGIYTAPAHAIFFLAKADRFSLRRLPSREALLRFWFEQSDVTNRLFGELRAPAFNNAYDLFQRVPAYELSFSLDGIDRDAIRAVMENPLPLPDGS